MSKTISLRLFRPGQTGGEGVTVLKNLWPKIQANLRLANNSHVAVGFPGEAPKSQKVDKAHGPMTNAQVAIANEFGSAPGAKPVVPARPFIGETVRRHKGDMQELASGLLGMIAVGDMSTNIALGRMGKDGADKVQETIVQSPTWAVPNAPFTKAKKKSSTPLIDTGAMRQAVTYKVRMKGSK